jgi:hypothetical protein
MAKAGLPVGYEIRSSYAAAGAFHKQAHHYDEGTVGKGSSSTPARLE